MDRPGQRQMAHAVTEAVQSGEHLLIQAGTGTGKSLAYLVPALATGKRVVVTTATLALQAQLVNHDLPRLVEAVAPVLGRTPTYALLKGRHHYACLARLEGSTAEEDDGLFDTDTQWLGAAGKLTQQVTRVREWASESDTGDRADLDPGVDDTAWRQVSMPARECVGAARCPFGDDCFAEAARAKARQADIVVTNHSLLAVDLLSGRHIVPEHALLVVDEAHELTDRVTSAAQAELTAEVISRAARRLRAFVDDKLRDDLEGAADLLERTLDGARPGRLERLPEPLYDALFLIDENARNALEALGGEVKPDEADAVRRNQAKQVLTTVVDTTQRLLAQASHDVAWLAQDDRRPPALYVAPLSVSAALGSGLFRDRVVVAASATLALGGRFDIVARSLGLDVEFGRTPDTGDVRPVEPPEAEDDDEDRAPPPPRWRALDVGSPFDYPKQGILYVASRLPRPGMSGLSEGAQRELIELVGAAGGRTLGLFSSRKAATAAADALRAATDLPVLLQGDDSIHLLVKRFREEPETCLLGVASLWQGVDVPGDACRLVVIDRLPFPRPDEPLTAARSKAVDDAGGSGFMAVSVPAAAIRLSQGAGRLIRAAGDRGVVAVLDSRLHSARYGEFIRRTLPPFWYTTSPDVVRGALTRLGAPAGT
ncbi:ATP-dependent DNA helicase [Cryptosporangium sp. NPDC051539]|uniref:ATP-dependent DNA helicase n=1 Tax=Cryptosporangium sp. NPDC051539 TaxID=3363962 RepID=UPI0037B76BA9